MRRHSILTTLMLGASLSAFSHSPLLNYRETTTLLDKTSDEDYWDAFYDHTEINAKRSRTYYDGNTILYEYTPDGTLLSKTYGAQKNDMVSAQSLPDGGGEESNNTASSAFTPTFIYAGTTEYSGDIIYRDGKLDMVLFPGGYCTFDHYTDEPQFHYFTQDHLGSNRAVVNDSGEAEQITHYYPFGGTFGDAGLNPAYQHYKYNGKLLDRVAGLNTYDYGARQYYPLVPTWDRMDMMCEKYYEVSPYAYCGNNPVAFIDVNVVLNSLK